MLAPKYAALDLLDAEMAPTGRTALRRFAHRWNFNYTPRPGFLYVRSRAISSRCNDNYDEFPAEEIKKSYKTFIGKPVFVNHRNDNHRRARGVVIDAALHEDTNPDGSPDTWTEVLMEVDAIRFPKLAQAIVAGHVDRTSMGTDVAYSICSACGNKASTPLEYCAHIPRLKGQRFRRKLASGKTEDILIREICYGLKFFENSLLVEDPADPTAFFLGVEGEGVSLNATATTNSSLVNVAVAGTATAPVRADFTHSPRWVTAMRDEKFANLFPRKTASRRPRLHIEALNEIVAPAEVDTLRDETCPVCGEKDTYDGNKCRVCGFIKPPDIFMDPDTDVAQQMDLRQDNQAIGDDATIGQGGDLQCDNCGDTFASEGTASDQPDVPQTQPTRDPAIDQATEQAGQQPPAPIEDKPAPPKVPQKNTLPKPKKDEQPTDDTTPPQPTDKQPTDKQPTDKQPPDQDTKDVSTAPKDGDTCPTCGKGTLHVVSTDDLDPSKLHIEEVPDEKDDSKDEDEKASDDDKDGKSKSKPPWLKDKKGSLSNADRVRQRDETVKQKERSMRPALEALAQQQKQLDGIESGLKFILELAGVSNHPRVASLFKKADENNPAQPIPTPGAEAPAETTQEALAPDGKDDVESIGASPVAATAPDATTSVDQTGTVLDEPLNLNEQDVTKPVAGTTDQRPLSETKTETDVRVGSPDNPQVAFPLEGDFAQRATTGAKDEAGPERSEGRTFAALRLARLRIQAGIAEGEDILLAHDIDASQASDAVIQAEIDTLAKVVTAKAASKKPVARNLVPRTAGKVERTTPSLVEQQETSLPIQQVASGPSQEEFLFD